MRSNGKGGGGACKKQRVSWFLESEAQVHQWTGKFLQSGESVTEHTKVQSVAANLRDLNDCVWPESMVRERGERRRVWKENQNPDHLGPYMSLSVVVCLFVCFLKSFGSCVLG